MFPLQTLLATIAVLTAQASADWSLPATAVIDLGVVIGTTTSIPAATATVNKFLGIPFAQSPPERFSPPAPAKPFHGAYNATAWKPACIQQFVYPLASQEFTEAVFNVPPPVESEDCLYLNVYAPSTPPPPQGRTVMFWIYGGSLQFGNAGQPEYDGSAFAAYEDVIVVSTNYRTNVFGFPGAPELPLTGQNLGFLDQHAGLEWVQRNIHAFGGDPNKVTIFGESAGAWSVDAILTCTTYAQNPPFRGAILESGTLSYIGYSRAPVASSWPTLTAALNCTSKTSNLTCVRAASATTIQQIIDENALAFNPFADNVTLVANPGLARQRGQFAHVPILAGTNAQEGRVFEYGATNVTALLESYYGLDNVANLPALEAYYAVGDITGYDTGYDRASQAFTDFIFQCPQALMANETAAQGVSTWRYYFNASFPNTQGFPGAGVYHSSEIGLVFQTYPGGPVNNLTAGPTGITPTDVPATAQEYALGRYMGAAWAAFAKDPAGGPGWNMLGTFAADGDLGALGTNGTSGVTVIQQASVDGACPLIRPAYGAVDGPLFGTGPSLRRRGRA